MELPEAHARLVPLVQTLMGDIFNSGLCRTCQFSHSKQIDRWCYLDTADQNIATRCDLRI
jgi:hypothetical protein